METRNTIWWWKKYLHYCYLNKIDNTHQTHKEYKETMQKVYKWVEQNDMLSQN